MGQGCHKDTVDVLPPIPPKVLMGSGFLRDLAQHELTSEEQFRLGEILETPTSSVQVDSGDAVTNTLNLLQAWRNSSGDVSDATALYNQLRGACVDINRADLGEFVRNALTEERIKMIKTAAEPVTADTDEDKSLRALHVMSLLKVYEQPDLWVHVSTQLAKDGHLDMSRVLTKTNVTYLLYLLTSAAATDIITLTLVEDPILAKSETAKSLGTCLASMSQLCMLVMSKCQLNVKSLQLILDGISEGCPQMEILDLSDNHVFYNEEACQSLGAVLPSMPKLRELHMRSCHLSDMSVPHVIESISEVCLELVLFDCRWNHYLRCRSGKIFQSVLSRLPRLTIRAHDCGLAIKCAARLTTEFGDRFNLDKNC